MRIIGRGVLKAFSVVILVGLAPWNETDAAERRVVQIRSDHLKNSRDGSMILILERMASPSFWV